MAFNMLFRIWPEGRDNSWCHYSFPEMLVSIKDTPLEFVLLAKNGRLGKELPLPWLLTAHTWCASWLSRISDGDWRNLPRQDKSVPLEKALIVNRSVRCHRPVARMMDAPIAQKNIGDYEVAVLLSSPKFWKLLISCASNFRWYIFLLRSWEGCRICILCNYTTIP